MSRHIWENLGSETKGDVLDIHRACKTQSHLCCHCLGSKSKQAKLNSATANDGLLGITGVIRIAPTAAIEVLLGLPPLHLQLEAETRGGTYRLYCSDQWKPKSEGLGHAYMTQYMKEEPILQMGTDRIYRNMSMTNHSVRFLTELNGKTGFHLIRREY
jgi:hypothetical protein